MTESALQALESHVAELLVLLQDRQPGMQAFHALAAEHIRRINEIAAPLLEDGYPPESLTALRDAL